MCIMRKYLVAIITLMCIASSVSAQYKVSSPNGVIRVELNTNREQRWIRRFMVPRSMTIRVYEGRRLVVDKEIGVDVKLHGHCYSFGKIDVDLRQSDQGLIESAENRANALRAFSTTYNRLQLGVKPGIILEVRAYNEGVAYQFRVAGIDGNYKVLRLCAPFPNEKPIAIVGTFRGDHLLPWSVLNLSSYDDEADTSISASNITFPTPPDSTLRPSTSPFRLVSWRNALTSVTLGASINMYHGSAWQHMNTDYSYNVNLTYKYLYTGISFAPCNEILFVHFQHEYEPFLGVMGSIHQWKLGGRLGLSLPFQQGMEVWNFTPYVAASLMRVRQHGIPAIGYHKPEIHREYLIGPGLSIQFTFAGRYVWAVNYEYQLFTQRLTPKGMHSLGTSIGVMF